jgi:hypothetical protein
MKRHNLIRKLMLSIESPSSPLLKYVTYVAITMHNTVKIRTVPIERQRFISSLWPPLHSRTHLCIFIVCTLLFTVVRVRRKLQTFAHGKDVLSLSQWQLVQFPGSIMHFYS